MNPKPNRLAFYWSPEDLRPDPPCYVCRAPKTVFQIDAREYCEECGDIAMRYSTAAIRERYEQACEQMSAAMDAVQRARTELSARFAEAAVFFPQLRHPELPDDEQPGAE